MGLLDRYRSFSGLSEAEVSRRFRARASERRSHELAKVDPVDCSRTTWHERPPADVVGAVTFAARRGLNRYADGREGELRDELAQRLRRAPETVVVGDGAAGILEHAISALLGPGTELLLPWPSYPLAPLLARDAGAGVVPVEGGMDPERLLAAVTDRTRLLVLTNPNDPTGELLRVGALDDLLARLPEHVVVLLDEALRDFVDPDVEARDATLALLDEHPRLLVVRTFSKAWGLAGLRCGYALGGADADARERLSRLAPRLGPSDLAVAGAVEALRVGGETVDARLRAARAERAWLRGQLLDLGLDVAPSQTGTLWVRDPRGGLHARLEDAGVLTQPGEALGAAGHVRVTVRDRPTSERLLRATVG